MLLVISSANVISGAEYVMSDYVKNTKHKNKIDFLIAEDNMQNDINKKFYKDLNINRIYSTKYMNPIGATKNKIKYITKLKNLFKAKKYVEEIINTKNYNFIIGNNTSDMVYSTCSKNTKIKYYQYIHDIIHKKSIWSKLLIKFDKNIYQYIVVSEAVKNNLIKLGISREKIKLIYNGISYKKACKKNYNRENINIGFVGSLIERKSPLSILELLDENIKLNVVFNQFEEKIKSELSMHKNINMVGLVSRDEIDNFYKEMDYIIVPSKNDPLPTVILESFNNGTPVIGRKIDGIPEMVNDENGILFNQDDELEKIKKKLKNQDEEDYLRLSKAANKTIEEKFKLEIKIKELDKIFFNKIGD